jgi:hypothetical protein
MKKSERFIIYDQNINQNDRRVHINRKLIKFIDCEVNLFKEILTIIRYLSDFIQLNNFGEKLLQHNTFEYRVFLEIAMLFNNYNKEENNISDRNYQHHRYQILGNTLEFMKKKIIENEIKNKCGMNEKNSLFGSSYMTMEGTKSNANRRSMDYKLIPRGNKKQYIVCQTEIIRSDKPKTHKNSFEWKDTFTELNSPTKTLSLSKENRQMQFKSTNKLLHKRLMSYSKENKEFPLLNTNIVILFKLEAFSDKE